MDIVLETLPEHLRAYFARVDLSAVNEIRLRVNAPVLVCANGRNMFLTPNGLADKVRRDTDVVYASRNELESILHKASGYSIYAVNEQLKMGFMTIRGGIRIGVVGEVVSENGITSTIKNIHALNIRIPRMVSGCSYPILPYIFGGTMPTSTLIIAPPGCGKTTMLRDIAYQISDKFYMLNTLIIDERGEIAATHMGECQLDVGAFTDVMTGCTKTFGFENGVRSMRPHVIITDEVATCADTEMIKTATHSGVRVIASVHAANIEEIRTKPNFRELVESAVFDRYVVLSGLGKIEGVYDRNLRLMAG
ncbi:MAG: AAA family ATPase [Firmicutes bacterium]|nr:AAA family ATPase [Bacillota bacterium]